MPGSSRLASLGEKFRKDRVKRIVQGTNQGAFADAAREREERRKAAGEQPPVELQEYHRLIVHVEHCMAKRPSPMGSLQGASERCAA